jgi:hypothetical protein
MSADESNDQMDDAILRIRELTAQRDACLTVCQSVLGVIDAIGRGNAIVIGLRVIRRLEAAIALCEQEKPDA